MALGMKPIQIMLTVIFEAIATSMIGVIFGSLLGLATNFYFQQVILIWEPHTKVLTLPIPYSILLLDPDMYLSDF